MKRFPFWLVLPALVVLGGLFLYPMYQLGLISVLDFTQAQVSGGSFMSPSVDWP